MTFSVLHADLVPRRKASLPLILWILDCWLEARRPIDAVLDTVAAMFYVGQQEWFPDPPTLYRLLDLFSRTYSRLRSSPGVCDPVPEPATRRERARWVLRVLGRPARGSPVLAYHRFFFPHLLFTSHGLD